MNRFLFAFCLGCCLISCNRKYETKTTEASLAAASDTVSAENKAKFTNKVKEYEFQKKYTGILPCADCEGIKTTLKIAKDVQLYHLTEEYLGKDLEPVTTSGTLNTERGFGNDRNATVYILNYEKPEAMQLYFLRETGKDGRLLKLDKNWQKIGSNLNYVLTEVK